MEPITLFFGKIIAPYLFASGLGFLISTKFYENRLKNSDKSDPLAINLSGMVHFLIGIVILTNHFLWNNILEAIVTLLGFSFLGKGVTLIVIPNLILKSTKTSVKALRISGIGFIIFSLILGYLSFIYYT
ncbi:MAG: hypothetical protein JW945_00885 [Methanomicrobia archaeon]|nr:hypothetical protein [Methanomicrobia archaeon]